MIKIITDRLFNICCRLISPNQFGFIQGRQIGNCIAGASECFNDLRSSTARGGHLAMKIDIRKAFDSIKWPFFIEVLKCFGFSETFKDWIASILKSAKISVLFDGSPKGYFSCTLGVGQGDPLSPLLFCLAEDFFKKISYSSC